MRSAGGFRLNVASQQRGVENTSLMLSTEAKVMAGPLPLSSFGHGDGGGVCRAIGNEVMALSSIFLQTISESFVCLFIHLLILCVSKPHILSHSDKKQSASASFHLEIRLEMRGTCQMLAHKAHAGGTQCKRRTAQRF